MPRSSWRASMQAKWVVAWISFFDNDLQIQTVEATSWEDALRQVNPPVLPDDWSGTLDEVKQLAFDCDGALGVEQV